MKTNDTIWIRGFITEISGQMVLVEVPGLGKIWCEPGTYTELPSTTEHTVHYDGPLGCGKLCTNPPTKDTFKVTCNDCNNALRSR